MDPIASHYAALVGLQQQMNVAQMQNQYSQKMQSGLSGLGSPYISKTPPKEAKVDKEILPDISLTRVFKWAVVLIVAMALGKKVWSTFGPKIEAQLHKALEHL